jgi:hypothetical protein
MREMDMASKRRNACNSTERAEFSWLEDLVSVRRLLEAANSLAGSRQRCILSSLLQQSRLATTQSTRVRLHVEDVSEEKAIRLPDYQTITALARTSGRTRL